MYQAAGRVFGKLLSGNAYGIFRHVATVVAVDTIVREKPHEATVRLLHRIYATRTQPIVQSDVFVDLPEGSSE